MKRLGIRLKNGLYLSVIKNRFDYTKYTNNIKEAYAYISVQSIENAIEKPAFKEDIKDLKDAEIINLDTLEVVRKLRFYRHFIRNGIITAETTQAICLNDKFWIPKSQIEIDEECIRVSKFIFHNKFDQYNEHIKDNCIELNRIDSNY